MKINMVGLEGEFFLTNKNDELVYPADFGFETDEYIILGEFRAKPGRTRSETIGEYFKSISEIRERALRNNLSVSYGFKTISPIKKAEIARKMGTKRIQQCNNLYKTDILTLSDDIVKDGKLLGSYISSGLHIHFSKEVLTEWFNDKGIRNSTREFILTLSQMRSIVRKFDKYMLPEHKLGVNLKYRNPGFYELKYHGFEYRSLPMYINFIDLTTIESLVDFSFSCLEALDK